MRYRITPDGLDASPQATGDVVVATVWFTLFVGLLFIVAGIYGRQRWLQFWGVLTCVSCGLYFGRDWLGLSAWLGI